ncbi:MAG: hypothetical protein ACTSYM_00460 [Candidatus Baldrarchaeia archaeon]
MIELALLEVEIAPYSEKLENVCRTAVKELTKQTKEELEKFKNFFQIDLEYSIVVEKENNRIFFYIPMLIPKAFLRIPVWGKRKIAKQVQIVMDNLKKYLEANGLKGLSYKHKLLKR